MRLYEFLRLEGSIDGRIFESSTPSEIFGQALKPAMHQAGERTRHAVQDRLPRATGRFRDSIQSRVASSGLRATVSEKVRYGGAVDYGARFTGPVPIAGLAEWAKAKLGLSDEAAVGMAVAIGKKKAGTHTEGNRAFVDAFDATLAANVTDFERALAVLVEGL